MIELPSTLRGRVMNACAILQEDNIVCLYHKRFADCHHLNEPEYSCRDCVADFILLQVSEWLAGEVENASQGFRLARVEECIRNLALGKV